MHLHAYYTTGARNLVRTHPYSNVVDQAPFRSPSGGEIFPVGVRPVVQPAEYRFIRVSRPSTSRGQCLVLSLAHLSSFLGTARACVVYRAAVSLGKGVAAAEGDARDTLAAAWSAQSVARQASSEALSAITRATSAAASARNEGSVLLEEVMLVSRILYSRHGICVIFGLCGVSLPAITRREQCNSHFNKVASYACH